MHGRSKRKRGYAWALAGLAGLAAVCGTDACAQISLGTAIDLALRNSQQVQIAEAEQAREQAALSETKDAYVPSLSFTSGLAKGTGFPPGDPSTFKLSAQGLVYNAAQPQFIRAARDALQAVEFQLENTRQQVILDTALTYAELDADRQEIAALKDQELSAREMSRIVADRQGAGLESQLAVRKVQLRAAQTRLKRLDTEARADVLRAHLSNLTGITASAFNTQTDSLPPFPAVPSEANAQQMAIDSSAAIRSAYKIAGSKQHLARGQHRVNMHPEFDLLLQYGYLYDFNDYSQYYSHKLPPTNAVAGVEISIPIFNRAQTAKAREADAEFAKAQHEAALAQSQVSEQAVQLLHAVEQTDAAADVARLQHEISAASLEATRLREQDGGDSNGVTITPADTAGAVMEERGLLADSLAAQFEHTKAELEWMRSAGTLTDWAKSALH